MEPSASVFVVHHVHVHENDEEDVKLLGVYDSQASAEESVRRLAVQPGFRDWPAILDGSEPYGACGFYISEYKVGEDHWTNGYVTDSGCDIPGWMSANFQFGSFPTDD